MKPRPLGDEIQVKIYFSFHVKPHKLFSYNNEIAAESIGFLGRRNPQHAFLRRGSKAVGPMS